ncbi:MAG: caspase family protein, partial [Ramlibacter sp.]
MQFIALVVLGGWRFASCLMALLLSFAALAQGGPAGEPRLALVIGNAAYRVSPLANPVNDARLMETALKNAGFQVMKAENANRRDMQRLIRDFGEKLKQSGGVGLFYFAGHGMQVRGNNYLIPLDADIRSEDEVAFDSIDAQSVLEKMETARNRVNLLILDACRDNPFIRGSRSASLGLATMNAPSG